jgi:hypothetical protein
MLATELHTRDIPNVYRRFADAIGERYWKRRVMVLKDEIRGNRFLRDLHLRENAIAFQLENIRAIYERFGATAISDYNNDANLPAASFAVQVLSIIDASDSVFAERFRRRVQGAFNNPDDMRGLRLELATATYFLRTGYSVIWPEIIGGTTHKQGSSFDLFVENIGPQGLEVECKSFSKGKGQRIQPRQALDFYQQIVKSRHWKQIDKCLSTWTVAVVTVPCSLPNQYRERQALAEAVAQSVAFSPVPRDIRLEGASLRIEEVDATRFSSLSATVHSFSDLRKFSDEITSTRNKETVLIKTKAGGVFILVVQSAEDDVLMNSIIRALKDAACRQLSGRRAGILVAGLDGLSSTELINVAMHEHKPNALPTALQLHTSNFLLSLGRDHVVGLVFFSAGAVYPVAANTQRLGGVAYYFPKRESPYWDEAFSKIFSEFDNQ